MLLLDDVTLTLFADTVRVHVSHDDSRNEADTAENDTNPQRP